MKENLVRGEDVVIPGTHFIIVVLLSWQYRSNYHAERSPVSLRVWHAVGGSH
jgi:hypothetical protein